MLIALINIKSQIVILQLLKSYFISKGESFEIVQTNDNQNLKYLKPKSQNTILCIDDMSKVENISNKIELFIVEVTKDIKTTLTIYNFIQKFNKRILFMLKVKKLKKIKKDYSEFFKTKEFKKSEFFILKESEIPYLITRYNSSIFEFATNNKRRKRVKKNIKNTLNRANTQIAQVYLMMLDVIDESREYLEEFLQPAFKILDKNIFS